MLNTCAACIYEEDHDLRDEAAMCARVSPASEHVPAAQALDAHYKRRRFRGDRVSVEDRAGGRWLLRPPATAGGSVEHLLNQVQEDLASLPLNRFLEKYRPLAE